MIIYDIFRFDNFEFVDGEQGHTKIKALLKLKNTSIERIFNAPIKPFDQTWIQGQARGYGRITHIRGRTSGGHYFQELFTAKPMDIQIFLGYQMKDLDILFPQIPHNTL